MITSRANATRDSIELRATRMCSRHRAPPSGPARSRHDRDRLVRHDRGEGGARRPVERVLQHAGNAVVELGRAEHEPVAFGDRREQAP